MGCDIHAFVESREFSDDSYWYQAEISLSRNYRMFGLLAGVRGNDELFTPKGFPLNASPMTRDIYINMRNDAHTSSWLTVDEFAQALEVYGQKEGWTVPPVYTATLAFMRTLGDSARLVFWFDN